MPKIHLLSPEGVQEKVPEFEIRLRFEKGDLDGRSVYWKRGMPDWQPVSNLVEQFRPSFDGLARQLRYNVEQHARTLRGMLFTLAGFEGLLGLIYLTSPPEAVTGPCQALSGVLFLAVAVSFLLWLSRTAHNVRAMGAVGLTVSPGWAVGGYFVPLVCLVVPYMAMKEILQASTDPLRWPVVPAPRILGTWWCLWILYSFVSWQELKLGFRSPSVDLPILSSLSSALLCATSLALARLVRHVQESQEAHLTG